MPVPLSSFSIVRKPRTATVWRGEHRGKTGTLCENNKTTGTMYTSDGLVDVDLKNCWYKKNGKKKNHRFGKESDSEYTMPMLSRAERHAINEMRKHFWRYVDYVKKGNVMTYTVFDNFGKGFIVLHMGGVLDCAHTYYKIKVAIGNAANTKGMGGGGIDGRISIAGGDALHEAREALPRDDKGDAIKVGGAVMTIAGNIDADYVIHAVGPNFSLISSEDGYMQLFRAYWNMLSQPVHFIAIPLISSGIYLGSQPLKKVVAVCLLAIFAYLTHNENKIAVPCAFKADEQKEIKEVYELLFSKNDKGKVYVELGKLGNTDPEGVGLPDKLKDLFNSAYRKNTLL